MAYKPHVLLAIGGKSGPTEEWSTSLRFEDPPQEMGDFLDNRFPDMVRDVRMFWDGLAGFIPRERSLDYIKVNKIGEDGKYVDKTRTRVHYCKDGDGELPGTGSWNIPPQCTVVATLRTRLQRGRASRGRMFLPTSPSIVAATGRLDLGVAKQHSDAVAFLVRRLNNDPGPDLSGRRVSVFSRIDGTSSSVMRVEVGNVVDTQRRRREDLDEQYATSDASYI